MNETLPRVILYTRKGCHLCDQAKAQIERLRVSAKFGFDIVDIDLDEEQKKKFTDEVPVIFINGRKAFKYRIEPGRFLRLLRSRPAQGTTDEDEPA